MRFLGRDQLYNAEAALSKNLVIFNFLTMHIHNLLRAFAISIPNYREHILLEKI